MSEIIQSMFSGKDRIKFKKIKNKGFMENSGERLNTWKLENIFN